jgi:uncharacterized membrane protein YhaH (DUF805 family)
MTGEGGKMTFGESIKVCLAKYAGFSGRASRSEFWWFLLFAILVQAAGGAIQEVLGALVGLALLLPSLAVGARRAHDIDKSGWWQLVGLIPIIGWILVIYWFAQPGAAGDNRFGAAPADAVPAPA